MATNNSAGSKAETGRPNSGRAPKKVMFVITKSNFGGAQKYVFELAQALQDRGLEVSVALGGEGLLAHKLREAGIRTIEIPHLIREVSPRKELSVFFFLYKLFRTERPDIVHLNSSKIGGTGSVAARIAGVPHIVFTAHGWAFNENRSPLSKAVLRVLYWIMMICAHTTICVSKNIRAQVANWPCIASKLRLVYNGIPQSELLGREEARGFFLAHHPELAAKKTWIATVAELHPIKGLPYLIEAAESFRDADVAFVIIGEGEERAKLEALIDIHGVQDTVLLAGFVPDAARYLHAFDCFVLPSLSEALGLSLIEAGHAGLPVIATQVGGIPEIIVDEITGVLVPSKNAQALAYALQELLKSPARMQYLGKALHTKVLEDFSLEHMAAETLHVYRGA